MNVWTGVVFVVVIAIFWLALVLSVLQVQITSPFPTLPRWMSRLAQLFSAAPPVCPDCGKPGVPLGRRYGQRWFGCPACEPARIWSEGQPKEQPDVDVNLTKRTA